MHAKCKLKFVKAIQIQIKCGLCGLACGVGLGVSRCVCESGNFLIFKCTLIFFIEKIEIKKFNAAVCILTFQRSGIKNCR